MHTQELIRKCRTDFTPMEESKPVFRLYKHIFEQSGSLSNLGKPSSIWGTVIDHRPFHTSVSPIFKERKQKNYIKLINEFLKEWDIKKDSFSDFNKFFIYKNIQDVLSKLSVLNPQYTTFELTQDSSVFFQSNVNGYNIYIELYFSKEIEGQIEAISNLYKDGKSVFAYGGSIQEVIFYIAKRISNVLFEFQPTEYSYGLSESTFTSTEF